MLLFSNSQKYKITFHIIFFFWRHVLSVLEELDFVYTALPSETTLFWPYDRIVS